MVNSTTRPITHAFARLFTLTSHSNCVGLVFTEFVKTADVWSDVGEWRCTLGVDGEKDDASYRARSSIS